jgi:hypothetical protein
MTTGHFPLSDPAPSAPPAQLRPPLSDRLIAMLIQLNHRLGVIAVFASLGAIVTVALNQGGWSKPGAIAFGIAWLFGVIGGLIWAWPIVPRQSRRQGLGMVILAILLVGCVISIKISQPLRKDLAQIGYVARFSFYHPS